MQNVAFIECGESIHDLKQDEPAVSLLQTQYGCQAAFVSYQTPIEKLRRFDLVILRTCWEYHNHSDAFLDFLRTIEEAQLNVWNPPDMVRWNLDKRYLQDLEQEGVPIIDTAWHTQGRNDNLHAVLASREWRKVVIKPSISAGSNDTHVVTLDEAENFQETFHNLQEKHTLMIQPFLL